MSDVTRLNTESPIKQALRLERKVRHVNEVKRGLRGLTLLLNGYPEDEFDPMYVVDLLDPLEKKLAEAAEELDAGYHELVRALGGHRGTGLNDLRLCQLYEEYMSLQPVANGEEGEIATERAEARQTAIVEEMLETAADTFVGVAAKLATVRCGRPEEPTTLYDKVEHRALDEIERLGGFTPQQQAAE